MIRIIMIIENNNNNSNNTSDDDEKNDNDDNDNKLPVDSSHKGPIMSPLLSLQTTVEFLVFWDAMSFM